MTIPAASFVGRVLAVFSRRSPGLRPPLKASGLSTVPGSLGVPSRGASQADSAQDGTSGRRLVEVTTQWKAVSLQGLLRHRGDLQRLSDLLDSAARVDSAPATERARGLSARLARILDDARDRIPIDGAPTEGDLREFTMDLLEARSVAREFESFLSSSRQRALVSKLDRMLWRLDDLARKLLSELTRDRDRARARDIASELDRMLGRVDDRAPDVAHNIASVRDPARERDLARDLVQLVNRARDRASDLAPSRAHNLTRKDVRDLASDRVRDLAVELGYALDVDFARGLDRALTLASSPAFGVEVGLAVALASDRGLWSGLIRAGANLRSAASDFVGADLTTVSLGEANLVGIRWDSSTRWPPEWADRVRTSSVENPAGSGIFVVLPQEGPHVTDRGSLAPMS